MPQNVFRPLFSSCTTIVSSVLTLQTIPSQTPSNMASDMQEISSQSRPQSPFPNNKDDSQAKLSLSQLNDGLGEDWKRSPRNPLNWPTAKKWRMVGKFPYSFHVIEHSNVVI